MLNRVKSFQKKYVVLEGNVIGKKIPDEDDETFRYRRWFRPVSCSSGMRANRGWVRIELFVMGLFLQNTLLKHTEKSH
jgi:hypothetical protein